MVGVLHDVLPWLVSLLYPVQLMDSSLVAHLYLGHHDENTLILRPCSCLGRPLEPSTFLRLVLRLEKHTDPQRCGGRGDNQPTSSLPLFTHRYQFESPFSLMSSIYDIGEGGVQEG